LNSGETRTCYDLTEVRIHSETAVSCELELHTLHN
jgi:hypothetical protein